MERIQKQLNRRQEDMEEGWDERDALLHWAEVCGLTRMDAYLLSFLQDEVALKPAEQVSQWQQTFAHLIGIMLRQGMPMEKVEPSLKFQQANQWAINAEEALLAALNTCARVTREISNVDWPSHEAFGTWIKRLQGQRISSDNVVALKSLSFLSLEKAILNLQDLFGASFAGAYLNEARLTRAHLNEVHLDGALLDRALLYLADLDRAHLDGVSLVEARLDGVSLDGAYLNGANLCRVSLFRARLDEANLDEANLDEASLTGATLLRTSLHQASLIGAILAAVHLEGASLRGANLAKANLQDIHWDDETNWDGVKGLKTAENVPEALKQQLGLDC